MYSFEETYNIYYRRLYLFVYKMTRNSSVAEEITQESFYQAFISFHRYNGSCEMFTWLACIAKNTYFKYLRKNKIFAKSICDISELDFISDMDDTEKRVFDSFRVSALKNAIKALPKNYRDVVVLRTYADLSFAEIGATLKISENSAKVIYFRAKSKLKEALKDDFM